MAETGVGLGQDEILALLLKSYSGERLSKEERQKLRGACHFCGIGKMILDEYNIGLVCDNCGRCPDCIQCS